MIILKEIEFLEAVKLLIQEYRIKQIDKNTTDKDSRRIAILVGEAFLRLWSKEETNVFQVAADRLMTEVCNGVKELKLCCDITPEEERLNELHIFNIDPLKISFVGFSKQTELSKKILAILKEAKSGNSKSMGRTPASSGNVSRVSRL